MEGGSQSQRRRSVAKQTTFASIVSSNTSPPRSLEWLLGQHIKIKTTLDEEITGVIYTFDRISNCLVLDCSTGHHGARKGLSFRILKIGHIKEIVSVNAKDAQSNQDLTPNANGKLSSYLPVRQVNIDMLLSREAGALNQQRQQIARIGVGVSKEAQNIFDALSKTLPCRWAKEDIIVLDEVVINPPYNVDSCKANSSSAASLARVKKVLEGERRRLLSLKK